MESLVKEGLCRSIGVSNFREEDLLEMKDHWTIPPAVNQVCYLLAVAGMPRVTDDDSSQFEYYSMLRSTRPPLPFDRRTCRPSGGAHRQGEISHDESDIDRMGGAA